MNTKLQIALDDISLENVMKLLEKDMWISLKLAHHLLWSMDLVQYVKSEKGIQNLKFYLMGKLWMQVVMRQNLLIRLERIM